MANLFCDANFFIDLVEERNTVSIESLKGHFLFLSPLSIHIACYIYHRKIPDLIIEKTVNNYFSLIPLSLTITKRAFKGPTSDFEDNLQLHSAVKASCDFFLTRDKELLKMSYFGSIHIVSQLK